MKQEEERLKKELEENLKKEQEEERLKRERLNREPFDYNYRKSSEDSDYYRDLYG